MIDTHIALALDTSGSFCSVAARTPNGVVAHRVSAGDGDHFEQLPSLVRAVCEELSLSVSEVQEIRVGVGPGSFTGLRIGMSFAKGLAVATQASMIGVSSFVGAATSHALTNRGNAKFLVIADARRNEVFMAEFEVNDDVVREVVAPTITPVDEVTRWVNQVKGKVLTPGRDFAIEGVAIEEVPTIALGMLAVRGEIKPFSIEHIALLEPHYLRAVSAKSIEERRGG